MSGQIRSLVLPIGDGVEVLISDCGEIFTTDHDNVRENGRVDHRAGKRINPTVDKYGYERCTFSSNGKRKSYYIHRLVAMAFIPNPSEKPTVNHIDGNKRNNAVTNLEWATHAEQKYHAIITGLADKNIWALERANQRKQISIKYEGHIYPSVKAARRATGRAEGTIRKYGEVVMP